MKRVYSCLFILIFLMACTTDEKPGQAANSVPSLQKEDEIVPFNANNPYEYVGQVHDQLFESYYEGQSLPTTIEDICSKVETIANENTVFKNLKQSSYQPLVPSKVAYRVQHQSTCLTDVIAASTLSTAAKSSLAAFCSAFLTRFETESNGETLYAYAAYYESTMVDNLFISETDKRIILTTTAVARHSAYLAKKKPKKNTDPDWTILVGNIMAATEGAEESQAKAITMALATGIAANQK